MHRMEPPKGVVCLQDSLLWSQSRRPGFPALVLISLMVELSLTLLTFPPGTMSALCLTVDVMS